MERLHFMQKDAIGRDSIIFTVIHFTISIMWLHSFAHLDEDYKEAWQSYLKLCRLSASDYFENLLKAAGIRSPFEEGCMKEIVDKLKKKIN